MLEAFSTLLRVYHLSQQAHVLAVDGEDAWGAARATLLAGGSPMQALDSWCARTPTPLDDAARDELRMAVRRILLGMEVVSRGCLFIAEGLANPRLKASLDSVIGEAIDLGWQVGSWGAKLRTWAAEFPTAPPT